MSLLRRSLQKNWILWTRYLALTRYLQMTTSSSSEPFMTALVLALCLSGSGGSVKVLNQTDCRGCYRTSPGVSWPRSLAVTLSDVFASHAHGANATWVDTCCQINLMPIGKNCTISLTMRHVFVPEFPIVVCLSIAAYLYVS